MSEQLQLSEKIEFTVETLDQFEQHSFFVEEKEKLYIKKVFETEI